MKRSDITLAQIADCKILYYAFWRAAAGKRQREEVKEFARHLDLRIQRLANDILNESVSIGHFRKFKIRDPKPREISAPCFRERVLHHAIFYHIGPVLDEMAVFDSYACRKHKGTIKAIQRVQHHVRRFPWYVQIDIKSYFKSINHEILKRLLRQRFKDDGLLRLLDKIIDAYADSPGCGLPIGALTSQTFANFYLDGFDRFLLEKYRVPGMVRYMDDIIWWTESRPRTIDVLEQATDFLQSKRALAIKPNYKIQRSKSGVTLCGFRIYPGCILLGKRRRKLYRQAWQHWERQYFKGIMNDRQLQIGYDSAKSLTLFADTQGWRRVVHANESS